MRGKLLWLGLILLTLAIYDLLQPILGDSWFLIWFAIGIISIVWLYYAILVRRASIQIHPKYLLLQGPIAYIRLSYGRMTTITSTQLGRHYPLEQLARRERPLAKSLYTHTCTFIELNSLPKAFKTRHYWFPRFLFGTTQPGLLLAVEDWMALNRDIELARQAWHERRRNKGDKRSLAARILDY